MNLGYPVPESLHSGFYWSKDDGGGDDNWSYKDMQSSSQIVTNKPTQFFSLDALPVTQPKVSEHWKKTLAEWYYLLKMHKLTKWQWRVTNI